MVPVAPSTNTRRDMGWRGRARSQTKAAGWQGGEQGAILRTKPPDVWGPCWQGLDRAARFRLGTRRSGRGMAQSAPSSHRPDPSSHRPDPSSHHPDPSSHHPDPSSRGTKRSSRGPCEVLDCFVPRNDGIVASLAMTQVWQSHRQRCFADLLCPLEITDTTMDFQMLTSRHDKNLGHLPARRSGQPGL